MLKADLTNAYTPSFGLMGHESLIMQQSDIGEIATSIKDCLRCGKCKPPCTTHVPRANLLYSPRNKILATSLLIEAFLYEEQTRRGVSLRHWEEFEDVADHCTVCHKCLAPCPVDIDFGDVSMNMRNLLRKMGKRSFRPASKAAMFFLNATSPETIKVMRTAMVDVGFKAQRAANNFLRGLANQQTAAPKSTVGTPPLKEQVIHFINKKMPGNLPKKTARALLDIEDKAYVPIIRNPQATNADTEAVFYFPGCGSERLFSQVGLATQAMLWHAGVQTVLPPGYLCCGYPQRGSGDFDKAEKIITDNRVLFHRVANTLNYLDIKTVVVSCGTCYDQLQGYEFEKIFPGCRIIDIHEFLLEKGITLGGASGVDGAAPGLPVPRPVPQPDEAARAAHDREGAGRRERAQERPLLRRERHLRHHPARHRDAGALSQGRGAAQGRGGAARDDRRASRAGAAKGDLKILTSCPSCLQGLQRYKGDLSKRPARGRLHRRRDGQPHPRRRLDARVRGARQRGRHRAGAGIFFTPPFLPSLLGPEPLSLPRPPFKKPLKNPRPCPRRPHSQHSRVVGLLPPLPPGPGVPPLRWLRTNPTRRAIRRRSPSTSARACSRSASTTARASRSRSS